MFADLSARLPPGLTAAAVAASDRDGLPVVLVAGSPTRLMHARGERLVEVPLPPVAHPQARAAVAADVDGDGREEWCLAGPSTRLLRLTPVGWSDSAAGSGSTSIAALDRRGTGRYALAVGGDRFRLLEADEAGRLHDTAPALGLDARGVGGLWAGPLLGDRPDLFVAGDGVNHLFAHAGDGHFTDADRCGLADPAERGCVIAALDADGDGRLDLLLGNWHGPNRLLLRQVDGTFRDRATPALALPGAVRQVVAADFDNDGWEELLVVMAGEPNRLFRHTHDGWRLIDPGPAGSLDAPGCVADLDGDGTLEWLVAGERPGLFHVSNANGWLRVKPLTRFGAPARGATVRVTAGGRTQVQVIDGGPHEPVAHFGLGAVGDVDTVAVVWPDGARATVDAPAVRRMLTLRHPDVG